MATYKTTYKDTNAPKTNTSVGNRVKRAAKKIQEAHNNSPQGRGQAAVTRKIKKVIKKVKKAY